MLRSWRGPQQGSTGRDPGGIPYPDGPRAPAPGGDHSLEILPSWLCCFGDGHRADLPASVTVPGAQASHPLWYPHPWGQGHLHPRGWGQGLPSLAAGPGLPLTELSFMACSLNPGSCAVFVKHTTIIRETAFLIGLERPGVIGYLGAAVSNQAVRALISLLAFISLANSTVEVTC